jgi:HlyD family secretion protein
MNARTLKRGSFLVAVVVLAAAAWSFRTTGDAAAGKSVSATGTTTSQPLFLVVPGRIEPASEAVKVTSELPGTLRSAPLEEGDRVRRGQVIAELSNDDYRARFESAAAHIHLREMELARLINGSREQERREALAAVVEAEATLAHAQAERQRYQELHRTGDISKSKVDTVDREYAVAKARYEATRERHSLVDAPAREDDRARAEAAVSVAKKQLAEAEAMWNRTRIRSPIDGVVLRKHLHAGESISDLAPGPVYTLADTSRLRVRIEVDERDVALIQPGQHAGITADAYAGSTFNGRVAQIGRMLGRKSIRGDEPTERVDQKILEALIDVEPGAALPIGLRVTCRIRVQ